MRRLAPLLGVAALLVLAAPAGAEHVPGHLVGVTLDVTTDGAGRFQVDFTDAPGGEFFPPQSDAPDAGLQVRLTSGELAGTVFGARSFRPTFSAFESVSPPVVVPPPSAGLPAEIQSQYAGGGLVVQERLQHVDGQDTVRAIYSIENPLDGGPTVAFRAFATADLFSGSDRGAGVLEAGPPRAVGGTNDHFGAGALLEEVAQSEWDAFDTTGFTTVFDRVIDPAGFQNFIDPALIDNGVGVQWNDLEANGLPDGQTRTFEVIWRFPRFGAITFGEGVTSVTGTVNAPLSLPVHAFFGTIPRAGHRICWSVSGLNPGSGEALTDDLGTVPIPLRSAAEGVDTVTATDVGEAGCGSPSGPQRSVNVLWSARPRPATIELTPLIAARTVGETHLVTATATGAAAGSLIQYSIVGPNAVAGTADVDAGTGQGTIRWLGPNPGHDVLTAFLDIDGDGIRGPGEPAASASADWTPRPQGAQQQTPLTLDDLPDPQPFREVNVQPVAGDVFVRLPGNAARKSQAGAPRGFVPLEQAAQIPVGSILETSRGRVALESTADARGRRTQRAQFFDGMFQVRQPRSRRPVTEMVLRGGNFRGCGSVKGARADASQRRRQGRRVRRVWGNGRGNFRTRGRYSSATVRGTTWLTEDRCGGTLTRVAARPRSNRVEVRDLIQRRTRLLRAGQSYFAARPLGRR